MKKKNERVIVITGASAGVGRAIAVEFAKQGARLGLIARGEEKLDSTLEEVTSLGGQAIKYSADVSSEEELEAVAQQIEEELGPIDIWVNNAMVTVLGKVKDLRFEDIKRVTDVNYHGSVNGILVASRRMLPRNRGHIIQIGSALAYQAIPLQSAYCASKFATRAFLQSFRIELRAEKSKLKLSEIHLPAINTPQFEWMRNNMEQHPMPVPPIFEPELVGRAVAYVADHFRREMWLGGPSVKVILGSKLAPRIAEWKLAKDGIKDQQTDQLPPTGEDNLYQPVNEDHGTRGEFGDQAKSFSYQFWLNKNRSVLGAASALLISGLGIYRKLRDV
jgi:NADP-dependent 3-hydroxy acid dehydrogenase YdfG